MELIPNVGIGSLRFGMSPAEVRAVRPEEQTYEEWMGGNLNDSLLYHGLIIGFDECNSTGPLPDSRLTRICVLGREDAVIWGQAICDWTKETVTSHLDRSRIPCRMLDSGDVSVQALSLSLSFDDSGRLEYVEMWGR
jgi:hypothetical protein